MLTADKMGAAASTTEEQDLEVFVAMKEEYEKVKNVDEQTAFDAVKKVYIDKMAEITSGGPDQAEGADGAEAAAVASAEAPAAEAVGAEAPVAAE